MVGSCEVLQTITHSFNSFREKSFMTIHLPVQTKQFNLNLKCKGYVKKTASAGSSVIENDAAVKGITQAEWTLA